jgi:hypothetical protein
MNENENTLIRLMKEFPDKPWSWYQLSYNPNITWDFIKLHLDKPWDWRIISTHIAWDIIQSNPEWD